MKEIVPSISNQSKALVPLKSALRTSSRGLLTRLISSRVGVPAALIAGGAIGGALVSNTVRRLIINGKQPPAHEKRSFIIQMTRLRVITPGLGHETLTYRVVRADEE
ncbi:hypothetical protein Tter_0251 [Thermobaculum terrenum ATCC BAA-798]|uniref:Transmembrane protein n=1 Tax=Thermobaculum terrenum (strain ATCC BAA-798 / CCMEE 7001 / YNP1) TaxID=525904 RepID=D1CE17_THET1|nr:hypothetical protein [Thermobaculum terrenum]ACZ41173.1 hypothetical protein Tter_0251 [Thermobaculum terrenum ATCC BAA-798]